MPLILGANSVSGYTVKNSLRFNSGSSDYLNRTPASSGNRQKWTWSCWLKKSNLSSRQNFFQGGNHNAGSNSSYFEFSSGDVLRIAEYDGAAETYNLDTTQVFRDVSAFYHIVVAFDTTQATSTNRVKLYVNGTQVTSFSASNYPTQNYNTSVNHTLVHNIGRDPSGGFAINGYMSDVYLIDGQQLTPSSFGETDTTSGIWIPKSYSGSYGTNGFYLKFANSASLGTDSSGNGNTFTVNNLTSVDQSTDTPTNNFATWNAITGTNSSTFTEGNLRASTASTTTWKNACSTLAVSTGKWYSEIKWTAGSHIAVGFTSSRTSGNYTDLTVSPEAYTLYLNGSIYNNNGVISSGYSSSFSSGTVIGLALDKTNNKMYWSLNGTFANSADPVAGTGGISLSADTSEFWQFCISSYTSTGTGQYDANFGSPIYSANSYTDGAGYGNFSYAVPSGYYALNTKNLANFG